MPTPSLRLAFALTFSAFSLSCLADGPAASQAPVVPDWALPGSPTHTQVPPPAGFRRASTTYPAPLGIFDGQSDIGTAVVPGAAAFNPGTKTYTLHSAGYNIWYFRDEFRFLWKKTSGDFSLAADVTFPKPDGYDDRKVVLIIRQDLDDDAKEVMTAVHGAGLIHLAQRPTKGVDIAEICRDAGTGPVGTKGVRLGLEKHGNVFTLYVGEKGKALKAVGKTTSLDFEAPFYVGIGFTSHLPATVDTADVSNVVFENAAGKVH